MRKKNVLYQIAFMCMSLLSPRHAPRRTKTYACVDSSSSPRSVFECALVLRVLIASLMLVLFITFPAYCETVDNSFEQLKSELKSKGVSDEFIKTTENSVKRMLSFAASINDIKSVLLDLWNEGVKGIALKNAVSAVAELVASGDNTLEAAKITSGAAHTAEAEGLSGFGVGMRVKKAVQDRKEYLKTLNK